MNFNFCSEPLEFRAVRKYERKDGSEGRTVIVEDLEGYQQQISVNDPELFGRISVLRRGEMYRFPLRVFANDRYQFAALRKEPIQHVTEDGDLEELSYV